MSDTPFYRVFGKMSGMRCERFRQWDNVPMDYLVTFLEGVITFVSPCLLPMLPIYVAYFAGTSAAEASEGFDERKRVRQTMTNAVGFVLGFTIVFVALGAFAGTFGAALARYSTALNVICGIIVIVFGLCFMGTLKIPALQRTIRPNFEVLPRTFPSAFLFGIVFSIGWTPCVGAYLGSALLLASTQASTLHGVGLLLVYSLGLGLPFLVSAFAIDQIAGAFGFIKRHYDTINIVCGALLVIVGILMATGQMNVWLSALSA